MLKQKILGGHNFKDDHEAEIVVVWLLVTQDMMYVGEVCSTILWLSCGRSYVVISELETTQNLCIVNLCSDRISYNDLNIYFIH